jgi:1,2-diacylglycerol 3-beta-galactosyltransferase
MRVLILMSDTGGGHRSAAEAISQALHRIAGESVQVTITDFLALSRFPFDRSAAAYARVVHHPHLWRMVFRAADRPLLPRALAGLPGSLVRRGIRRAIQSADPDVVVSVHPLATVSLGSTLRRLGRSLPFVVVVTDLLSIHVAWAAPQATACTVATSGARQRLVDLGVPQERVSVLGLPVDARFADEQRDKAALRRSLGLEADPFTVLLVGGGEGAGGMEDQVAAIARRQLPVQLVAVAGRNQVLQRRLGLQHWGVPLHVLGFVRNMPELMHAADLLVTKAGPGTISEALICGLAMVLTSALPGQEEGNVGYVVDGGAGVAAPTPQSLAAAVEGFSSPGGADALAAMSTAAKRLSRPRAAEDTANLILSTSVRSEI